ncbi:MAG: glycosyltransferase [Cyclobacteriaceae bacterium]|jgi:glycosyltransferase involved in cell wall biosynthesis|nr:glycosyltransferase [Cyclobacteriaceae bacterium]
MQESKKMKIVVASVLKPVDDTRMFEKIGSSFARKGFEVHLFGNGNTNNTQKIEDIFFHHHIIKKRLSLKRWFIPFWVFRKLLFLKPQVVVIASHELLWMAVIYRLFFAVKVVYDVRENYALNIKLRQKNKWIDSLLSHYMNWKQKMTSYGIDVFWLAESCYLTQLSFLPNQSIYVVENRASKQFTIPNKSLGYHSILFTGTLASSTGVLRFIEFAKYILKEDERFQFTIAGHSYDYNFLQNLKELIQPYPQIQLIGGSEYVAHATIYQLISQADFGFIDYPIHVATQGKKATKYFEYAASGLPIITSIKSEYATLLITEKTGLVWNEHENAAEFIYKLKNYTKNQITNPNWFWESSENQLIESIAH